MTICDRLNSDVLHDEVHGEVDVAAAVEITRLSVSWTNELPDEIAIAS